MGINTEWRLFFSVPEAEKIHGETEQEEEEKGRACYDTSLGPGAESWAAA